MVDLQMVYYIVGTVGTIVTVASGFVWHIYSRINQNTADLAQFKVEVAREYASSQTLERVENRIMSAINRLTDRLDNLLQQKLDSSS